MCCNFEEVKDPLPIAFPGAVCAGDTFPRDIVIRISHGWTMGTDDYCSSVCGLQETAVLLVV